MTKPAPEITPKTPPPSSGSDRQQRYRANRKLISIDISADVRDSLQRLRARLQETNDAVLRQALALLTVDLDRQEQRPAGRRKALQSADNAATSVKRRGRSAAGPGGQGSSPGDAARSPSTRIAPQPHPGTGRQTRSHSVSTDQPGLFDDAAFRPSPGQSARRR